MTSLRTIVVKVSSCREGIEPSDVAGMPIGQDSDPCAKVMIGPFKYDVIQINNKPSPCLNMPITGCKMSRKFWANKFEQQNLSSKI